VRVSSIKLHEVGPFSDAEFEIPDERMVFFEGPNGSGKTTLLEVIACGADYLLRQQLNAPGWQLRERMRSSETSSAELQLAPDPVAITLKRGEPAFAHQDANVTVTAGPQDAVERLRSASLQDQSGRARWLAFAFDGHPATASLRSAGPAELRESPMSGGLSFSGVVGNPSNPTHAHRAPVSHARLLGQWLVNTENERVKANQYRGEAANDADRARMTEAASARQASIKRVENCLSKLMDRDVRFSFSFDRPEPTVTFDGEAVTVDLLGEGFRKTFSWISDFLIRLERAPWLDTVRSPLDHDIWLLLDEVDQSLHPTMQLRLYPALLDLFPNARIYATTHSPFVIASAASGVVFPLRPQRRPSRVEGRVTPVHLEPGLSLARVVEDIFKAPSEALDPETRGSLDAHASCVAALLKGEDIAWEPFLATRKKLLALNDEIRAIVFIREARVRPTIDQYVKAA
jgi:hypothetical protein